MENLQGYHKHKIGRKKKHKTLSSVIYVGKSDKSKRKYFKPEVKKYDHTPHEVGSTSCLDIYWIYFISIVKEVDSS
jgi:hypothetical protein